MGWEAPKRRRSGRQRSESHDANTMGGNMRAARGKREYGLADYGARAGRLLILNAGASACMRCSAGSFYAGEGERDGQRFAAHVAVVHVATCAAREPNTRREMHYCLLFKVYLQRERKWKAYIRD